MVHGFGLPCGKPEPTGRPANVPPLLAPKKTVELAIGCAAPLNHRSVPAASLTPATLRVASSTMNAGTSPGLLTTTAGQPVSWKVSGVPAATLTEPGKNALTPASLGTPAGGLAGGPAKTVLGVAAPAAAGTARQQSAAAKAALEVRVTRGS